MPTIFILMVSLFLNSCGVKDTPSVGASQPPIGGQTPIEGVFLTEGKKFLIRPARLDVVVNPQLKVIYQIVDQNLEPVGEDFNLRMIYLMPDMPQMSVTPAKVERVSPGKFSIVYDISMEGKWEFVFSIERSGTLMDSFRYSYEVPLLL